MLNRRGFAKLVAEEMKKVDEVLSQVDKDI